MDLWQKAGLLRDFRVMITFDNSRGFISGTSLIIMPWNSRDITHAILHSFSMFFFPSFSLFSFFFSFDFSFFPILLFQMFLFYHFYRGISHTFLTFFMLIKKLYSLQTHWSRDTIKQVHLRAKELLSPSIYKAKSNASQVYDRPCDHSQKH